MNARSDSELPSVASYAWALAVLVPALGQSLDARVCVAATALFAGCVIAGVRARGAHAAWWLLVGGAAALALPIASRGRVAEVATWAWGCVFAGFGLYATAALRALARPVPSDVLVLEDVRDGAYARTPMSRVRGAFLAVVAVGAIALIFVPIALMPQPALERAWSGAAREAELLSNVVAVALAAIWIGVLTAPAMRKPRAREVPSRRSLDARVVTMSVCAVGFTLLAWLLR